MERMIKQIGIERSVKSPIGPQPVFNSLRGHVLNVDQQSLAVVKLMNIEIATNMKENSHLNLSEIFAGVSKTDKIVP